MAFWDASAIVPLCCSQPAIGHGRKLLRDVRRMVVWWGTSVEARSAFARLVREGPCRTLSGGRRSGCNCSASFVALGTKSSPPKKSARPAYVKLISQRALRHYGCEDG